MRHICIVIISEIKEKQTDELNMFKDSLFKWQQMAVGTLNISFEVQHNHVIAVNVN